MTGGNKSAVVRGNGQHNIADVRKWRENRCGKEKSHLI